MANGFFSVDKIRISNLGTDDSVVLLHNLLHAEARRLKVKVEDISVPFDINDPDGGIDAYIKTLPSDIAVVEVPLIYAGQTYYQVKSGTVHYTEAGLKDVLCIDSKPGRTRTLKPKIKEIAQANGTLVLFFTGESAPHKDKAEGTALELIQAEVPATEVRVRIIQIDNIIGLLEPFLSIRLGLLGLAGYPGVTFEDWAAPRDMSNYFQGEAERDQKIKDIRKLVASDDVGDRSVRISGFPGVGKTRSVLEALREPRLSSSVIYFDKPSTAVDSGNLAEIALRNDIEAIIVIDECDRINYAQVDNIISSSQGNLKLVTIFNESVGQVGSVKYVDLGRDETLSKDAIVKIIESYGVPHDIAERWADYCDGSPRVAHMIGENLKNNPDDLLLNPSYDSAMERFLANKDDLKSQTFENRKKVLCWLSLFAKFGWHSELSQEREFILHKIIEKTGMSEEDIDAIVADLKDRKVLQGDKTLYISPRLLHIRAWVWWWGQHKATFNYTSFHQVVTKDGRTLKLDGQLQEWFADMFQFAKDSEGASGIVKELLSADGPLSQNKALMGALEGKLFLALTRANRPDAVSFLNRWFSTKTDDEIRTLQKGRQNLVWALEIMAMDKDLFVGAARLLLRLARTEDDHTYSNNSEGTFSGLFSNGMGKVAPSAASPKERFVVLEEAVRSKLEKEQSLGLGAIYSALETDNFVRIQGAEIRGLESEPDLWMPKTWQELYDAYKATWDLLIDVLPGLSGSLLAQALDIFSNRLRGVLRITSYAQQFLGDYSNLVRSGVIPKEQAVHTVALLLKYDTKRVSPEIVNDLRALDKYLEGDSFESRLRRFVASDITDDWWGDDDQTKHSHDVVDDLARQALADPNLLETTGWLFSDEAKNGIRFGKKLGDADQDWKLFDKLMLLQRQALSSQSKPSIFFLAGYLLAIHQSDIGKWHKIIDGLTADEQMRPYAVEIIWRNGLDEKTGKQVLDLVKSGQVNANSLGYFRLGAEIKNISDELFDTWVEQLLAQQDGIAGATALELFSSHYVFQESKPLPSDLTLRVLTMDELAEPKERGAGAGTMMDYEWAMIAKRYIEQYPQQTKPLIDFVVSNYGKRGTLFESYYKESTNVLNELAKSNPDYVWDKVAQLLEKRESGSFHLGQWLGGPISFHETSPGALSLFDRDKILGWIDKDPQKRALFVAEFIPHDLGSDEPMTSWVAIILDRYGNDSKVRSAISSNLWGGGFSGPRSLYYAGKLENIRRFKKAHRNSSNIQLWADEFIPSLEHQVDEAKTSEERDSF